MFQELALLYAFGLYDYRCFKLEVGCAFFGLVLSRFCHFHTFWSFPFFVCGCDVLLRPIPAPQNSRCFCFLLFEGVLSVISFIIKLIRKSNELFLGFFLSLQCILGKGVV